MEASVQKCLPWDLLLMLLLVVWSLAFYNQYTSKLLLQTFRCMFFATTMGLAHGEILWWMNPASSKFLISCFRKSWCLRAKQYGQAATWAASGLVAMCISMRSVWSISLSLLEIIVSCSCNSLYTAVFVSSEILVLLSSTCFLDLDVNKH